MVLGERERDVLPSALASGSFALPAALAESKKGAAARERKSEQHDHWTYRDLQHHPRVPEGLVPAMAVGVVAGRVDAPEPGGTDQRLYREDVSAVARCADVLIRAALA